MDRCDRYCKTKDDLEIPQTPALSAIVCTREAGTRAGPFVGRPCQNADDDLDDVRNRDEERSSSETRIPARRRIMRLN